MSAGAAGRKNIVSAATTCKADFIFALRKQALIVIPIQ
jgi:hypothetical protein